MSGPSPGPEASGPAGNPIDKRGNVREPSRSPVKLRFPAVELAGLTRDVSDGGAFVLAAQDLEVECEVEGEADGEPRVRLGRVVRVELLPGGGVGFAVEFRR